MRTLEPRRQLPALTAVTGCGTASARDDLPRSLSLYQAREMRSGTTALASAPARRQMQNEHRFHWPAAARNYAHHLDIAALPFVRECIGETPLGQSSRPEKSTTQEKEGKQRFTRIREKRALAAKEEKHR